MNNKINLISTILIAFAVIFAGCNGKKSGEGNNEQDSAATAKKTVKEPSPYMKTKKGLTVSAVTDYKKYPDAKLSLEAPDSAKAGKVDFNFKVDNFKLKKQTPDASKKVLANSSNGQHIHFILNNGPYDAHYESTFKKELSEGNHIVLAFLSRSYHMSVKNKESFVVKQIKVGSPDSVKKYDMDAPHLFYSRPKGTYKGEATKKILLDFFPVNVELGEDKYKVKATINGTSFILSQWKPYVVEGLPMGKNTFRIQLLDSEGNPVKGPFNNSGKRTIMLKKSAS